MYIGSATNLKNRWSRHKSDLIKKRHHNVHLQRAWDNYGEHAFQFLILEEIYEAQDLIIKEQHYIDLHKSYDPQFGYNICPIAGSSLGIVHSKEACENFSKAQKRRYEDLLERQKTGAISKENWKDKTRLTFHSKKMKDRWSKPGEKERQSKRMKEICSTVEHRQKLSVGHMKHYEDPQNRLKKAKETPHRKEVRCIETGQVFISIAQAAKTLGVSVVKIRDSATGKRKSNGGISFEWVNK
jgi:group I intron endonuclease